MSRKKCIDCGSTIDWKVIPGELGKAHHRGLCISCSAIYHENELPEHIEGRALARKIGAVKINSRHLKGLSTNTKIGYYREIQHCATCQNAIGEPCECIDCNCIYCKTH